jgi:hypothetical protein
MAYLPFIPHPANIPSAQFLFFTLSVPTLQPQRYSFSITLSLCFPFPFQILHQLASHLPNFFKTNGYDIQSSGLQLHTVALLPSKVSNKNTKMLFMLNKKTNKNRKECLVYEMG